MGRTLAVYLLLFLGLALFGGFAFLTRHPDTEIVRQAESWPWIGPLASRFRDAYLPRTPTGSGPVVEMEEIWIRADGRRPFDERSAVPEAPIYRQHVWGLAGMELKAAPAVDAATLVRFESVAKVGKIERRGDWYRVDHHGRTGWLLLEDYDETAEVPYGEAPEPPRPIPSRAPDEEHLTAARQFLRGRERILELGPYTLYTDSQDDALLAYLGAVAAGLETTYTERYGQQPIGTAAEVVVLFQSDIAYRLMQQRTERLDGLRSAGHNSKGIAAFYIGGRSRSEVASTLIHELIHFLNRRAIGPQLPPWLDEGVADDLAQSRIDSEGRIRPGELGGSRLEQSGRWRAWGAAASQPRLRDAVRSGQLPAMAELIRTDWESFVRSSNVQLHYAAAAFWVRFLIEGENGRYKDRFRAFLAAVAEGAPPNVETLEAELGEELKAVDQHFRRWLLTVG